MNNMYNPTTIYSEIVISDCNFTGTQYGIKCDPAAAPFAVSGGSVVGLTDYGIWTKSNVELSGDPTITGGIGLAVKILIFVLIVQQIEGNVVAPKLQGKSVDLHPIWVMFALLACSEIWGPIGMLISTPVAAVVKTALRELYYYMIGDSKSTVAAIQNEVSNE